jgi:hypothetical protein
MLLNEQGWEEYKQLWKLNDSNMLTPVPPFALGRRHANPMARVSDDDGFVRPRTGGSRLWKTFVTFEDGSAFCF